MTTEKNTSLVPELKGAPLSVLFTLCGSGEPLTAVELQDLTGYSDKPVSSALNKKLEPMGMARNHGRMSGWTITRKGQIATIRELKALIDTILHNLSTSPLHDEWGISDRGVSNTTVRRKSATDAEKVRNAVSPTRQNAGNEAENSRYQDSDQNRSDLDQNEYDSIHYSDHVRSDLIRSDQTPRKQEERETYPGIGEEKAEDIRDPGEIEALKAYLSAIGIEGPGYRAIVGRDRLVDVVAWHWYTLGRNVKKPAGYIIACLENGDNPGGAFLESARSWLTLSEADLSAFYSAGSRPYGTEAYWHEKGLTQRAIDILESVKQLGGLDLLDDFNRPILPKH